ncbi:MAG TPA: alpha-2-macroglobulin family protein, partial [Burkholderiaceae bacterium]|nr:alpha-2-macroglobulin family protein [Burkholderiaceae bacterium]
MAEPDTSPRSAADRGGQSWRGATWVGAVLATAVMILLGWRWWNVPQGDADATTAGDPNAPFAVLECSARMLDDRPALAVVFSQPVDRKQKLEDVLRVVELGALTDPKPAPDATGTAVRGSWVVEENPRLLVFPYISVQKRFRIEVLAGLRSQDGAALAAGSSCDVASEALPPSFQFASRGVVLPAGQSGGLPIITTNVPEVDVQFLKVQPAEVTRFLERVAGSARAAPPDAERDESGDTEGYAYGNTKYKGAVGGWQLDELRRSTKSVYLGRFSTTDQPNKRQVSFLPVET